MPFAAANGAKTCIVSIATMNGISKLFLLEAVVHTPGIDGAMTVTLKFIPLVELS